MSLIIHFAKIRFYFELVMYFFVVAFLGSGFAG